MPKRQNNHFFTLEAVVDVVPNSVDLQASSGDELGVLDALTNARLQQQETKGRLQIFAYCIWGRQSILPPPRVCPLNLGRRPRCDAETARHCFAARSRRAKSSSSEMVSPRSASAIDSSSSASSSGLSVNPGPGSRVRIVTTVPSGRVTPSKWTLPPTTVPVAIPMAVWYAGPRDIATRSQAAGGQLRAPGKELPALDGAYGHASAGTIHRVHLDHVLGQVHADPCTPTRAIAARVISLMGLLLFKVSD